MFEQTVTLCVFVALGVLLVCWIVYLIVNKFGNPLEDLDESDIKEIEDIGISVIQVVTIPHGGSHGGSQGGHNNHH